MTLFTKSKAFFTSKINWLAIAVMLVGLSDYIDKFNFADMTPKGWVTFGLGAAVMLIRTFFTSKPVSLKK